MFIRNFGGRQQSADEVGKIRDDVCTRGNLAKARLVWSSVSATVPGTGEGGQSPKVRYDSNGPGVSAPLVRCAGGRLGYGLVWAKTD